MLIPIYTIFKCRKATGKEFTPDPSGWTEGAMEGFTCWETMEEAKNALDSRFNLMKEGRPSIAGLSRPLPIKNTLEIDENGSVQGAIYYKYLGVEYQCYVAQLIIAKKG